MKLMKRWLPGLILGVWMLVAHSTAESAMQEAKHFVVDIISINGEEFAVKDESGKEATVHVGTETEKFGQFQVGDRVDAWIYPNGQAKTLLIIRKASIIQEEKEQQKQREVQQRAEAQPQQTPSPAGR
jgi:predicted RNA-binding protein (virulence factor B family)